VFDSGIAVGFLKVVSHQAADLKSATPKIESILRPQRINSALEALKAKSKIWMDDAYFASPTGPQSPPKPTLTPSAPTVPK
jgi:hypothetical protein